MRLRPDRVLPARLFAVASAVAIVVLSTLPGTLRPHTGFPGDAEHFVAYCGTAFLLTFGFPAVHPPRIALAMSIAAAVFEVLQIWIPGRHPGLDNWAFSTAGAVLGLTAAHLVRRLFAEREG